MLNASIDRRRWPAPPLSWCRLAALDAKRMHPNWPRRSLAVEGYRVAFYQRNPGFGGVVIMPGNSDG